MPHAYEKITQPVADRWGGEVARRVDARIARPLYRQPVVDGGSRCDFGAQEGVRTVLAEEYGAGLQRDMLPFIQDCLALRPEDAVWS